MTAATAPSASGFVVAYDIAQARRRRHLHRLLSHFGAPLQESVFMCWLDAPGKNRLDAALARFRKMAPPDAEERIDCFPVRTAPAEVPSRVWVAE